MRIYDSFDIMHSFESLRFRIFTKILVMSVISQMARFSKHVLYFYHKKYTPDITVPDQNSLTWHKYRFTYSLIIKKSGINPKLGKPKTWQITRAYYLQLLIYQYPKKIFLAQKLKSRKSHIACRITKMSFSHEVKSRTCAHIAYILILSVEQWTWVVG